VAIVPIVIDLLNIRQSFIHHWEAYGFYAPAVADYEQMGIMQWQGTPEHERLMQIVEPFSYRSRFTMPKCIINACGDQFFLPDSSRFYFSELPAPKYLRYVPNADHSLRDTDAASTLTAFYHAILNGTALPNLNWVLDATQGSITVTANPAPRLATFWHATNPDARDFRLESFGPGWTNAPVAPQPDGRWVARLATPAKGWSAGLIELTFDLPGCPVPFKCSTEVLVVPDQLPFHFKPPPPPRR
jgi:PhoPQ-activated pathogenicity-related protein